ncbi:MAG: NAD(P)/FAD-dependent oxidoreductase [Candidatus Baltobacteraceae bacterium]
MEKDFDLIVIGTGSAGTTVATRCRKAGWSVAIVDRQPFGGTCSLRGCDPKKVLVGIAQLVDWSERMHDRGVVTHRLQIDWAELMRFKRTFTDSVSKDRERAYAQNGISSFHGSARFVGHSLISVGEDLLNAKNIVIASGAKPAPLHVSGEEHLATSTDFLELPSLPKRLIFVGGGFISFEFAHVAARAGADASILEREARVLAQFEDELVQRLVQATQERDIKICCSTTVTAIEKTGPEFVVHATRGKEPLVLRADLVVHGGGRVADIDDLQLEVGGVTRVEAGVDVDEYLQSTSNPAVYAVGDCAAGGGAPLTPVAALEGDVVAENLLNGNKRTANFSGLASMVYALPPLAMVGLTEDVAREQGLKIRVQSGDSSQWYSSRRGGAKHSAYKIIFDECDKIIGAHLLGFDAEELANICSLAIRAKVTASALREVLFAYPTGASELEYML